MKPRLLDLFCGAGGAAVGYHRAGFEVEGVDINLQPNYPFPFTQGDALEILTDDRVARDFDAVHASPPCQAYSTLGKQVRVMGREGEGHPDLVAATRELLEATELPFVIENVPGAPLHDPVMLCGSMFDPPLDVQRHRLFETNWGLEPPVWPCRHKLWAPRFRVADKRRKNIRGTVPIYGGGQLASVVGVYGHLDFPGEKELRERAMGIDWMTSNELTQAIPPAYTELIGTQLLTVVREGVNAA